MRHKLISTAVLLCALWYTGAAISAGVPGYYPAAFAQWGEITGIDVDRGRIVMADITLQIDPNLRVYTPNTQHETIHGLRPGMRIAVGRNGGRSAGAVTEVWVLPADYQPSRTAR